MKEKIKKISNEEFKLLVGFLRYTYQQFCFNKIGHKEIGKEPYGIIYNNFIIIWNFILVSLRNYYLINFAKIFDKESCFVKGKKKIHLSIFRAIPREKFNKDDLETILKIIQIRNETLAHLEAEAVLQKKFSEEDYGLDFEGKKIESLIGKTFELINQIREDFSYVHELNQSQEKDYIQREFNRWFRIFKETYIMI